MINLPKKLIDVLFSKKDLKRLLIPLVIEQVLVMLVGMVDMVSYLVITVFTALTTEDTVFLSQYLGSGHHLSALAFSA